MARVECEVIFHDALNDRGQEVPSVKVICSRCGHACSAFGTKEPSVKHALIELRETCPEGESNFYVAEE